MNETNTSKSFLMYKATPTAPEYTELCGITSYPDIFTAPPRLDVTNLSDTQRRYIPDIVDVPEMVFGSWYDKVTYTKIKALQGKKTAYQLKFGDDGEYGKWSWEGDIFVTPVGGGVSGVREMQITAYPATEIEEG